jgi:diguanylate cyclase (GGDEF)-like protein
LRFEQTLEARFQHDMAPRRIKDFLITGVLALCMFNLFLPVDYLLANDVWSQAINLRLKIYTPFWAVAIAVFWVYRDIIGQRFRPWVHELVVITSGVTAGATLSYILASSHGPLVQYYHLGLMVIIIYGNLVQRLRFGYAVAFSAVIYAMHVHGAWVAPTMDSRLILPIVSLVGAAGVFSLMANHAIDADERKNYLMSLRRRGLLDNLQQVHRKLTALVRVDPLTEQFNRRHVTEFLQQAWTKAAVAGENIAVVMVDVDHFKPYNDHYGHPQGDRCLVRVAHALATSVRGPTDLVGRYGGEEFMAILTQVEPADAQRVAERMRFAVEQMGLAHAASSAANVVTVSVGVACMPADARLAADHVLQAADQALYRAKHQGRNRVSV